MSEIAFLISKTDQNNMWHYFFTFNFLKEFESKLIFIVFSREINNKNV